MSRTLKDRPYWVQLNESKWYDHDHTHLGEEYYIYKSIKDADGNLIYDDTPWGMTADQVIKYVRQEYILSFGSAISRWYVDRSFIRMVDMQWYYASFREDLSVPAQTVMDARNLVAQGRGTVYIPMGTYKKLRRERKLSYTVADHCTEWEAKYTPRHKWHVYKDGIDMPCTPSWSGAFEGSGYSQTRDMAKAKRGYSQEVNGHSRRVARDTLKGQANAWNSGWDVDDWDEDEHLTPQHRHSMNWMLW
jgi:hypothetical protein